MALFRIKLEDVAHVYEADDVVDAVLIDGNARKLFVNDELAEIFDGLVFGDGDDVGPGRHDFADALIAECHHRLNELAVFLGEDAFFFTGCDECVDVLGRVRDVGFAVGTVIEFEQ